MKKMLVCVLVVLACCVQDAQQPEIEKSALHVTVLQEWGGRVSWLHHQDIIAFDKPGTDGYADVYTMLVDGSGITCLTCDALQPHNGNPSWHPSGEYIVFQAQNPDLWLPPGKMGTYIASPGVGINNNIWVTTKDGSRFWQITNVKDRYGVLHPHFSPDGTQLVWSEIISPLMDRIGHWAIKLADFAGDNDDIVLTNVQTLTPHNLQLYEMHGFSPDGTKILFSGIEQGKYYYDMEIYVLDVKTGSITQLTDNNEWDEHAHFTPDGSIMWVSSEGIAQKKGDSLEDIVDNPPKLEYWIMNADGSGKRCLSGFNRPGSPEYQDIPGGIGLGDFDVGPDGKTIIAKMRRGYGQEMIVLIVFDFNHVPASLLKTYTYLLTAKHILHIQKVWEGWSCCVMVTSRYFISCAHN